MNDGAYKRIEMPWSVTLLFAGWTAFMAELGFLATMGDRPRHPISSTGQTYLIENHGPMYVTSQDLWISDILSLLGLCLVALAMVVGIGGLIKRLFHA